MKEFLEILIDQTKDSNSFENPVHGQVKRFLQTVLKLMATNLIITAK